MYLSYYGLSREAFHIAPDPDFFYMSKSHREALAAVLYGVEKGLGFIVMTGEVGTGKTTVLRTYLDRLRRTQITPIFLLNPNQSFDSLLSYLLDHFDVESAGQSEQWKLQELTRALVQELGRNRRVVLVIDEAHHMPNETYQRLHLISNLELPENKLIQIVLVGQPELEEKLKDHALRQIRQRIAVRAHLEPLSQKEAVEYISHRLVMADGKPEKVMAGSAIKAIVKASKGFPRAINVLCDNVLVTGLGYQMKPVTARLVKEIVREQRQERKQAGWRWILAGISFVVASIAGVIAAPHLTLYLTAPVGAETAHSPGIIEAKPQPQSTASKSAFGAGAQAQTIDHGVAAELVS